MPGTEATVWMIDEDASERELVAHWFEKQAPGVWLLLFESTHHVDCARRPAPEVLVLENVLPGEPGLDWLARHRALLADTSVFLLTAHPTPQLSVQASHLGAAFILKPASFTLLAQIARVAESRRVARDAPDLDPSDVRALGTHAAHWGLTPRQTEILGLLVGGSRPKDVARATGLSVETVKKHVSEILRRAGRPDMQAVLRALRRSATIPPER